MMPSTRVTPIPQQPPAPTERIGDENFVFLVCQHGAEAAIKARWISPDGPYRLAFSRPGLLTLKIADRCEDEAIAQKDARVEFARPPEDWLIRQSGFAFGQLRGQDATEMAQQAIQMAGTAWDAVHVFARDPGLPGLRRFEPGATELCRAVSETVGSQLPGVDISGLPCETSARVLDIVLAEPNHWLVGHHRANNVHQCWPGGALPIVAPTEMISRAYLKIAEALVWSQLPIEAGDKIVEIGSSPGGSCQRLLDLGLHVTGIDPAEMDPLLLQHPRFEHWRTKAAGVKRKLYRSFRWLAADANVAPNYTLAVVEEIVKYPTSRIEGLLLTIKLSSYDLADQVEEYLARIRGWGFPRVQVRQLATNRRECCIVAHRSNG